MIKVTQCEFDGGSIAGNDNRTKVVHYRTDDLEANAAVTKMKHDWRDRQLFAVDAEEYSGKQTNRGKVPFHWPFG